jgi:hypothetical protein
LWESPREDFPGEENHEQLWRAAKMPQWGNCSGKVITKLQSAVTSPKITECWYWNVLELKIVKVIEILNMKN